MIRQDIVIVTPALAAANSGNWQTAQRWARMLAADYRPHLAAHWSDGDEAAMIALHARRSAAAVAAWHERHPRRPLVVVLTGTDVYGDLEHDTEARRSLDLADRIVVLQPLALARLEPRWRRKATVSLQSCPPRAPAVKTARHLRALMVGHLRDVKMPGTYFDAARMLRQRGDIRLDHIGAALDPALGRQAKRCMRQCPQYRWLGALPHAATRARIQGAHVLVHASRVEGGAHVVIEALASGTPVLASRIDGNVGLLGARWPGYFPCDDAAALAALLERCRDEPAMLARLRAAAEVRAPLFAPARERETLRKTMNTLLERSCR